MKNMNNIIYGFRQPEIERIYQQIHSDNVSRMDALFHWLCHYMKINGQVEGEIDGFKFKLEVIEDKVGIYNNGFNKELFEKTHTEFDSFNGLIRFKLDIVSPFNDELCYETSLWNFTFCGKTKSGKDIDPFYSAIDFYPWSKYEYYSLLTTTLINLAYGMKDRIPFPKGFSDFLDCFIDGPEEAVAPQKKYYFFSYMYQDSSGLNFSNSIIETEKDYFPVHSVINWMQENGAEKAGIISFNEVSHEAYMEHMAYMEHIQGGNK